MGIINPHGSIGMENPVYFLVKYYPGPFYTCYAKGIPILNIPDLYNYRIMRFYPIPAKDLTGYIVILQRKWRSFLKFRKWCGHPLRIFYREINGRFPLANLW